MTFYIILGISSFLISLLGTRLTIMALRRKQMMFDHPNLRSNHVVPTPKGGGIAVVFALIICLLVADIHYAIVLSLLLLAAVSLLDDLITVPPLIRLLVQVMAAIVALGTFHGPIFGGFLPHWLDRTMAVLLWTWFTNLFNFMDGIDGLSAAEMISIGAGFCLLVAIDGLFPNALAIYGLIIASAGCGFIWWNWQPAKIFLGDVGSIPIGFLLGYLLLLAITSGYWMAAVILPAYYLADSGITLIRRIYHRRKIWEAHSDHYYQRAVRNGRRHSTVVRYVIGINILLVFLTIDSTLEPELLAFHISMAYLCVFMLLGFFAHTGSDPHIEL